MSRIISWFVHNPVASNLFMCVLLAGGMLSLPAIHLEEFPSVDTDMIRVSITYLGATPEEVEESVCIRVEEAIDGTQGVDRITSLAVEGACVVSIELVTGTDSSLALDEIKNRVDGIDTFPIETERPVVSRVLIQSGVMQVAISGDTDERSLKVLGRQIRDEIAGLPGVSQVDLAYSRPYEISIEVPEDRLRRHGLSFDHLAQVVRRSSLDMPGGSVKTSGGEILLRTKGQAYRGEQFEDITIMTDPDGTVVRLGEIATIQDGFENLDLSARFNGNPAVVVEIRRAAEEDIQGIAAEVRAYLDEARARMPEGVTLSVFADQSRDLESRLNALSGNARSGLILVLLVLGLFLRFRLAMWVAAGVPIALSGALMFFPTMGLAISTLSVMAFILVLGILVDDAIVVGESVFTRERSGESQLASAIGGTLDVYIPVTFGVLTTVAAFLPLVLVEGRMGQFFEVIGYTAMLCLAFSLLESQLILPSHLAHRRVASRSGESNAWVKRWTAIQSRISNGMETLARVRYGRLLAVAIEWRYVTLALAVSTILLAVSLFASGRMRYQFFPAIEGDVVWATLTMPRGTPVVQTQSAVAQIEAAAEILRHELDEGREAGSAIVQVLSTVGSHQGRGSPHTTSTNAIGSHLADVSIELLAASEREVSSHAAAQRWRELAGPVPDAVELTFTADGFSAGAAFHVELRGPDVEVLTQAAAALKERLASRVGVSDINDSFRRGKREARLAIRPEAELLGLSLDDLARQVRQAFYGEEVQRIQRGRDDLRVMLRYPDQERRSLGDLEAMQIRTADGAEVPFPSVAQATHGRGYATIRRTDHMRVVEVIADVDRKQLTPEALMQSVQAELPAMLKRFPGVTYSLAGEQREHGHANQSLVRSGLLALLLIYGLLAIPLRSYQQPLIIMSVIPFGAVGAILGHLLMGWDLVFFSVLGIVALSGVVVNASLVLVHHVNRKRGEGAPLLEAVAGAGIARFRPIVLTSMTTYIGLVPLMFESDLQARMMIPMAISLGYGVLFASVFSLFLVPCLYVVLEDLKHLRSGSRRESIAHGAAPTV